MIRNYPQLGETFTPQEFIDDIVTKVDDKCLNIYGYNLSSGYVNLITYVVYEYYKRTRIAYEDKSIFIERMIYDLTSYVGKNTKLYDYYISLLNTDAIKNSGVTTTNRNDILNQNNNVFTKQANTPAAIQPSEDFVNQYTSYQSDSARQITTNDTHSMEFKRTYGELDIMKIYDKIPDNMFTELIDSVSQNFITYDDLEQIIERCEYL